MQHYAKLYAHLQTAERREALLLHNATFTMKEAVTEAACWADQVCVT